jgi:phage-related baseplate assembly protein
MSRFFAADISQLARADLIETIDYEAILAEQKAWVTARWSELRVSRPDLPELDTLVLETEPITIILEAVAYRETLLRALVNDKARAVLLAYATGTDLDHLGALFATARREIATGVMQSDTEYREEIQLAPEAFSTAGPEGAYVYFARRAHASICDAAALNPNSNRIDIVLLSREPGGIASDAAITAVRAALSAKTTRPLTDDVHVRSASIAPVDVAITLRLRQGPAPEVVQARALGFVNAYLAARRKIGLAVRVDGLIGAARAAGDIEQVVVQSPAHDVDPGAYGAVIASAVAVGVEVV